MRFSMKSRIGLKKAAAFRMPPCANMLELSDQIGRQLFEHEQSTCQHCLNRPFGTLNKLYRQISPFQGLKTLLEANSNNFWPFQFKWDGQFFSPKNRICAFTQMSFRPFECVFFWLQPKNTLRDATHTPTAWGYGGIVPPWLAGVAFLSIDNARTNAN